MTAPTPPSVRVVTWHDRGALVIVDDVRVRINRYTTHDLWKCDQCGDRTGRGHCPHTSAAAEAAADPTKYRPTTRRNRA